MSEECSTCEYNRQCFIKKNVGIFECERETIDNLSEEYGLKFVVNGEDYDKIKKSLNEQIEDLQQKVEQLENIRKEAIEYVENNTKYYDADYSETYRELCSMPGANDTRLHVVVGDTELLNILNKGE